MDAAFVPFLGVIFSLIIATLANGVDVAKPTDPAIENYRADQVIEEQIAPLETSTESTEVADGSSVDQLAKCLTEKGAKMYGAYWCPHCSDQKKSFGSAFQYVTYIECDAKGENPNPQACRDAQIEAYPTWKMSGYEDLDGSQSLPKLSQWSKCPYLP
jgi:hypothetical protein